MTSAQFAAGRERLNGTTISRLMMPAHMSAFYSAIRNLEQPPPDVIALEPVPYTDDRTLANLEQRVASLLVCAREVGFGEFVVAYLTTDGELELSIRLQIKSRLIGTEERSP